MPLEFFNGTERIQKPQNAEGISHQEVQMISIKFKDIEKLLFANGFVCVRVKGSHHQYKKAGHRGTVTVPCHGKDIAIGTLLSIEKQSGLSFR